MTSLRKTRWRVKLTDFWPGKRARKRFWRTFRAWPLSAQVFTGLALVITLWFAVNGVYQVVRKPTELFFPVSGALLKTPSETWQTYQRLFRKHATAVITPEFLAALAQVEGSGNPVAMTYWRWNVTWDIFELYRPASSAVGMYQITDGTFVEAKEFCIHSNTVVQRGPWHDFRSCWFNSLYIRVMPSHAVEMTSAYLDRRVAQTLERRRIAKATLQQKQDLAALIHLCGNGAAETYARRNFRLTSNQRCGDHDVRRYLAQFNAMKALFTRMAMQAVCNKQREDR